MADVIEILKGILVLIYGIAFYIIGRANCLERFVVILTEMLEESVKSDDKGKEDESNG